jgi:hypothetical protein
MEPRIFLISIEKNILLVLHITSSTVQEGVLQIHSDTSSNTSLN